MNKLSGVKTFTPLLSLTRTAAQKLLSSCNKRAKLATMSTSGQKRTSDERDAVTIAGGTAMPAGVVGQWKQQLERGIPGYRVSLGLQGRVQSGE